MYRFSLVNGRASKMYPSFAGFAFKEIIFFKICIPQTPRGHEVRPRAMTGLVSLPALVRSCLSFVAGGPAPKKQFVEDDIDYE